MRAGACVHGCAGACMCMRVRVRVHAGARVRVQVCVHMCVRVCTYEDPPPLKVLGLFFRRVRIVRFSWLFQEFQLVDR